MLLLFLSIFILLQLASCLPWGPEGNTRPRLHPSNIFPYDRRPSGYPEGFNHGLEWPTAPISPSPPHPTQTAWAPGHVVYAYGHDGFFPIYNPTTNSFYKRDGSGVKVPLHEMIEEDGVWIPRHEIMQRRDQPAGNGDGQPVEEPSDRAPRKLFGFGRSPEPQNMTSIQLGVPAAPIWTPEVIAAALAMIPLVLAITVVCVILLFILLCCFKPRDKSRPSLERGRPASKSPHRPAYYSRMAAAHQHDLQHAAHVHDLNLANRQFRAFHPPRTDGVDDSAAVAPATPVIAPPPAPSMEEVHVEDIHPEVILERPKRHTWLSRIIYKSTGKAPTPENEVYMRTPGIPPQRHPNTSTLLRHAANKLALQPAIPSTSTLPGRFGQSSSIRIPIPRDSMTMRMRTWSRRERWLSDIFNDRVPGTENIALIRRPDGSTEATTIAQNRMHPTGELTTSPGNAQSYGVFSCSSRQADTEENVTLREGPRKFRLVVHNPDDVTSLEAETGGYTASAESIAEPAPRRTSRESEERPESLRPDMGQPRLSADAREIVDEEGNVRGVTVSFAAQDEILGSDGTGSEGESEVVVSSEYSEEEGEVVGENTEGSGTLIDRETGESVSGSGEELGESQSSAGSAGAEGTEGSFEMKSVSDGESESAVYI